MRRDLAKISRVSCEPLSAVYLLIANLQLSTRCIVLNK